MTGWASADGAVRLLESLDLNCPCGSRWAAITSEWEECCREEGFCDREPVYCRARRCWLCGHSWNEVLSWDDRHRPRWIYDGETIWPSSAAS